MVLPHRAVPSAALPWAVRFPALLPVVAPLTLVGLVVCAANIVQTDTWVALVSGREVALHGLPSVEHLTVLAHGRPWVDQQWLAQLALYEVDRLGGVGLVVAVCAAAALAAFALAAASAQARGASPIALALWVPLAFLVGPWGVQARTQSLALPLFALTVWLVLRDPDLRRRSSLWLLAVLCVWANVHGSVTLAAAVVCAHGLQSLFRTGFRRLPLAVFLLAPAAVLASPYAPALPGYYRTMLLHPPYGRQIVEWQRTTPANAPLFFAIAVLALVVVAVAWRRLRWAEWTTLGLTFAAALSAFRLTPWFGLALLAVVPPLTSRRPTPPEFGRLGPALVATLLLAITGAGLVRTATRNYDGPRNLLATLQAEPASLRVYADLPLADWALWNEPGLRGRVAYDGRPELMTPAQFTDVIRFARLAPGWAKAVRGYSLIITNHAVAEHLIGARAWTAAASSDGIVLLRRARGLWRKRAHVRGRAMRAHDGHHSAKDP